jgi:hypothetical protein
VSLISILKTVHLVGVAYFLGFLMLDVFVIRRFLNENCHDLKMTFYNKAKISLHLFVTIILLSGFCMLYFLNFSPPIHIWLKITFALTSFTLFFASPYIVSKFPKIYVRYIYAIVLALALGAFLLGKIA